MFPKIVTHNEKIDKFINTLAPIVVNEYIRRKKLSERVITPATVIAQAILESGWNLESDSLFGIKGEGQILDTTEYIDGAYVEIKDSFVKYQSIAEAVVGYYDLMQWDNYDDATSAIDCEDELIGLTNDVGYAYATDPDYASKCLSLINEYNLRQFTTYARGVYEGTIIQEVADVWTLVYEDKDTKLYRRM